MKNQLRPCDGVWNPAGPPAAPHVAEPTKSPCGRQADRTRSHFSPVDCGRHGTPVTPSRHDRGKVRTLSCGQFLPSEGF
jgi:hypothetical protein